jgi:3-deoxy-7-phosphoheptulonate synthase
MIIVMRHGASNAEIDAVVARIRAAGLGEHVSRGTERTLIGAIGDERALEAALFERMPGVERAMRVVKQYRIVARETCPTSSIVQVRGVQFGGEAVQIIAGPPAIESDGQIEDAALSVRASGCRLLHGAAFKQRDNPYSFQGLGVEGLELLRGAGARQGLPVLSELTDVRQVDAFLEFDIDALIIGARSMANADLLKEVGRLNKPVVLKRGPAATLGEWLMAGEYIAAGGNHNIIFCECGVKSMEPAYRTMLDLSAVVALKQETHLPVIVEPAHATGKAWMVPSLSAAALAAGADGLLIDMHPDPAQARCHAEQAMRPDDLASLVKMLSPLAKTLGRSLPPAVS